MAKLDLAAVNRLNYVNFIDSFGNVIEHCPVIAAAVWRRRPFSSLDSLHQAFCDVLDELPVSVKEGVLRCHPDLAGRLAQMGALTSESRSEQGSAGLLTLSPEEQQILASNNASYIAKFHFPFVICARQNKKEAILTKIVARQENTEEDELMTGINEVKKIARFRLENIIEVRSSNI